MVTESKTKTRVLEQLTLKGDLFVNSRGHVVKVEPIGLPIISTEYNFGIGSDELHQKAPVSANSYAKSLESKFAYETNDRKDYSHTYAVQYYNSGVYQEE